MNPKPTLILSDLHLGCEPRGAFAHREEILCDFLREMAPKVDRLILLGDVFEFWMEYKSYIPKTHVHFLSTLGDLSRAGLKIHYFAGNHDFQLGRYFSEHLGIRCHSDDAVLHIDDRKLYFVHGDGLDAKDWKYRWARKLIRNPLNQFFFKLLHPDWGMALARFVGSTSRESTGYEDVELKGYSEAAKKILKEMKVDAVVHGHIHQHLINEYEEGLHVVTGEWIRTLCYTLFCNGKFELKKYSV